MMETDKPAFAAVMNTACKSIGKPVFDSDVLELNFSLLSEFTIEQVQAGLYKALDRPGIDYGITVAKIKAEMGIKGHRELNWTDVLRSARNPVNPMGVLARMFIKSWELDHTEDRYLKGVATAFLDDLPDLISMADHGEYTEHQLCRMYDYRINPSMPFMPGLKPPVNQGAIAITWESAKKSHEFSLIQTDREQKRLEALPVDESAVKSQAIKLSSIIKELNAGDIKQTSAEVRTAQLDKLNTLVYGVSDE